MNQVRTKQKVSNQDEVKLRLAEKLNELKINTHSKKDIGECAKKIGYSYTGAWHILFEGKDITHTFALNFCKAYNIDLVWFLHGGDNLTYSPFEPVQKLQPQSLPLNNDKFTSILDDVKRIGREQYDKAFELYGTKLVEFLILINTSTTNQTTILTKL